MAFPDRRDDNDAIDHGQQQADSPSSHHMEFRHFPGLNGLRALAALGVVGHHIEQARFLFGYPNLWQNFAIARLGPLCVSFFFVLSGFLITYLLLEEKRRRNTISISRFYARRVLRIWPLYFFICLLGFFIVPLLPAYRVPGFPPDTDHFWAKLGLYLVFSPHVASALFPVTSSAGSTWNYAGVLWSVGVEEWFYLLWPWIILLPNNKPKITILTIIVTLVACRSAAFYIVLHNISFSGLSESFFESMLGFLTALRFDCMAIGAFGAYYLHRIERAGNFVRDIVFSRVGQAAVFLFLVRSLYCGSYFGYADDIIYPLMFLYVIINTGSNPAAIVRFDGRFLDWLGKISYGLYCYNWLAIVTAISLLKATLPIDLSSSRVLMYGLALALTMLFAQISYVSLERPFLRIKRLFSGDRENGAPSFREKSSRKSVSLT